MTISLVDHNENPEFESVGRIVQIIDHHKRSQRMMTTTSTSLSPSNEVVKPSKDENQQDILFLEGNGNNNTTGMLITNDQLKQENNKDHISHADGLYEDGINGRNHKESKKKMVRENQVPSPEVEINENVGSCSSLVAKRYFDSLRKVSMLDNHVEEDDSRHGVVTAAQEEPDIQVVLLLYGPVILGELFCEGII